MERIYYEKELNILYYSWYNAVQAVYDTNQIPKYKHKNLKIPLTTDWLLKDKKETRYLRVIFNKGVSRSDITEQTKWMGGLNLTEEIHWSGLYSI